MTFQHLIIIAFGGVVIAAAAIAVACYARGRSMRAVLLIFAFLFMVPAGRLFLVFNPWLTDDRFQTYRAFYKEIEPGMTRPQVLATMERNYPKTGARGRPKIMEDTDFRLGFFMNPETTIEPNCEGIFLSLTNGRVAGKVYSPD